MTQLLKQPRLFADPYSDFPQYCPLLYSSYPGNKGSKVITTAQSEGYLPHKSIGTTIVLATLPLRLLGRDPRVKQIVVTNYWSPSMARAIETTDPRSWHWNSNNKGRQHDTGRNSHLH